MSLLQELGAQLRSTSDELPTGLVSVAMERLRSASELLNWVRQTSVDPMGVPQLGNATEHAEHAAAALRVTQDAIASYLAVLGLSGTAPAPGDDYRAGLKEDAPAPYRPEQHEPPAERLGPWWQERVAALTGEAPPPPQNAGASGGENAGAAGGQVAGGAGGQSTGGAGGQSTGGAGGQSTGGAGG
ncbi:hypothetical protein ACFOHP_29055, partial [Couchioplanes caeruleus subsp. azureus]